MHAFVQAIANCPVNDTKLGEIGLLDITAQMQESCLNDIPKIDRYWIHPWSDVGFHHGWKDQHILTKTFVSSQVWDQFFGDFGR